MSKVNNCNQRLSELFTYNSSYTVQHLLLNKTVKYNVMNYCFHKYFNSVFLGSFYRHSILHNFDDNMKYNLKMFRLFPRLNLLPIPSFAFI